MKAASTPQDQDDVYVNTDTAAAILHCSDHSLLKYRVKGTGPVYTRLLGRVFYRPGDLRAWQANRPDKRRTPTPQQEGK